MWLIFFAWFFGPFADYDSGRLSVYRPNDGHNNGRLACGGRIFTRKQTHIAYRGWRRMGCGRRVYVCAEATDRCAWSRVMDAGPFGIYRGPLKRCVSEGRWKVWTKRKPPQGWRWRAVADLSWGLWLKLGRPRGLSRIHLFFAPRGSRAEERAVASWVRASRRVREVASR